MGVLRIFRCSFSMPDVHSIGLGGGTRVHISEEGHVGVGPDSVGNRVSSLFFFFISFFTS